MQHNATKRCSKSIQNNMKAKIKECVYDDFNNYCDIATVKELQPEYPYNTMEYKDALNALIQNLHKISPSDIWKLIGE